MSNDVMKKVYNDMWSLGIGIYKSEDGEIKYIDPMSKEGQKAQERASLLNYYKNLVDKNLNFHTTEKQLQ